MSDYRYDAEVMKIMDGDTVLLRVDLGFNASLLMHIRLIGINAPELPTAQGKVARDYLAGLLPVGTVCVLESYRDRADKYGGRWLGTVRLGEGGNSVNDLMVSTGHARPWDGQGPKPV